MVVWSNTYSAGTPAAYISGKRIRPDGSFPTSGSDLTVSDPAVNYVDPDITYNLARNEYLVVWDEWKSSHDIWAVRLTGNAVQLGGGPFAVAGLPDNETHASAAACNLADQYLVAWQSDVGTGGTDYAIYGYFIKGDGSLEYVFQIDNTTLPEMEADAACSRSGNQYLVVYQQKYVNLKFGITGRLVNPDHSMGEAFEIIQPGGSTDRTNPAVAGGPGNYLVAWEHQRDGTSFQDIHGRLVIPNALFLPLIMRQ
jgi:hypothetical protein